MIMVEKEKPNLIPFPLSYYGVPEDAVFFDIETTGLSPYQSSLYLIGALSFTGTDGHFRQWFADSFSEELAVLRAFFSFIERSGTLVSFNGDGFDIHYLQECAREYAVPSNLDKKDSIDLLKISKRTRKLTNLPSYRQKAVEEYLGIRREDPYGGLELISLYESYVKAPDEETLQTLLLHNDNDVLGLPELLPMTFIRDLIDDPSFLETKINEDQDSGEIRIIAGLEHAFPVPVIHCFENGNRLRIDGKSLTLAVRPFRGMLRKYYSDYRSYSFLPLEGYAVHNKLAAFVDASRKQPCTRENCFTTAEGVFLPLPGKEKSGAVFRSDLKSHGYYILSDVDPDAYLKAELRSLS